MDDREFFQLEVFEYQSPRSRRSPRATTVGHRLQRVALEVNDPVAVHSLCARRSVAGLSPITSIRGQPHFCLNDPNGVLLEVGPASRPVPARVGARFAGVALSVPSLEIALRSFRDAIGCPLVSDAPPDKGALWNERRSASAVRFWTPGQRGSRSTSTPNRLRDPGPRVTVSATSDHERRVRVRDANELRAAWTRMQRGGFRPHGELVSSAARSSWATWTIRRRSTSSC